MIDANQTILPPKAEKDPGYHELGKRDTVMHDLHSKVIRDNQNRIIIKVDESYGLVNAGIIGQMTHGGPTQFHSSPFRNSHLYKGPNFNQTSTLPKPSNAYSSGRSVNSRHGSEDSSSSKQQLERKIFLIKKMIKNEKQANEMISNQLSHLSTDLHMNNSTMNKTVDLLKAGRSGAVPQKM